MKMNEKYNCRICGFELEEPPWGDDGRSPNYNICPCCGVEFGYEDYAYESIIEYRKSWFNKGAGWMYNKCKPSNWNKEEQIKNIPKQYL